MGFLHTGVAPDPDWATVCVRGSCTLGSLQMLLWAAVCLRGSCTLQSLLILR